MVVHGKRRWLCLLTALLFAISSAAHVYAATEAAMKMPAVAMETSSPNHGMDCGGDDKAAHAACMAMCATAVAILSDPVEIPLARAAQNAKSRPEMPPAGRSPLPEPHPPKR